jgi:hypothetical protein
MNETITLRLVFDGNSGRKVNMSFTLADKTASGAQVKTLMQNIITNGDIFAETPQAIVGAEFVSRGVTPINVA